MTISETYAFLNSIRWYDVEIARKQMEHDGLQSCLLPKAITYDKDRIQTSPEDPLLRIASDVIYLEHEIQRLKAEKAAQIVKVNRAIGLLDNDTDQLILLGFYVGRLRPRKIAELAHYSRSGLYKAKRKAVENLADKLSESGNKVD